MTKRINWIEAAPDVMRAMRALQGAVSSSGLEKSLLGLVQIRASYLNGCAYCIDMHTKDARAAGETEQRIYAVPVWKETPFFTPRERAALAWTEAVTRLGPEGVPDEVFRTAREQFDDAALTRLTLAVIAINGWNRLLVPLGADVGSYQPGRLEHHAA